MLVVAAWAMAGFIAGGPAAKAGVKVGDLITAIEGKPIGHFFDLRRAISAMRGEPRYIEALPSTMITMSQKLGM